jgi:hypothetical protein
MRRHRPHPRAIDEAHNEVERDCRCGPEELSAPGVHDLVQRNRQSIRQKLLTEQLIQSISYIELLSSECLNPTLTARRKFPFL